MVWRVLKRVYRQPLASVVTVLVAIGALTLMIIAPIYSTAAQVLLASSVSILEKLQFIWSLYGILGTNYTILTASTVVLIACMFGVNVTLLMYYLKRTRGATRVRAVGRTTIGGTVAAILGIGCAACGSAVLLVVLKLLGITWLLAYAPLEGAEFGLLGVAALMYVAYTLIKHINEPLTCSVE